MEDRGLTDISQPLLDVRGVTLQYKTREFLVTATYRVDFQVHKAERFVILGAAGPDQRHPVSANALTPVATRAAIAMSRRAAASGPHAAGGGWDPVAKVGK